MVHPNQHQQQIPSVGLLYGVNQGKINRPVAQAGFLLQKRPESSPYKPYQIPVAVQVPVQQPTPSPQPMNSQPKVKFTNIFRKITYNFIY
jgi:hypothetical protein